MRIERHTMELKMKKDNFYLGNKEFTSRFILGSGKYSMNLIQAAVENAHAEIITLAVRRTNTKQSENILDYIPKQVTLLPNTSGARNAKEAVRIAKLSRELGLGVGISSGANFIGAVKALELNSATSVAVTVFADDNKKYLSTDLMNKEPVKENYISSNIKLIDIKVL